MPAVAVTKKRLHEAIRGACRDCMGGSLMAVQECARDSCKHWPFRMPERVGAVQTNLWRCNDPEEFARLVSEAVTRLNGVRQVSASTIRYVLAAYPLHSNWFGSTIRMVLRKRGFRVVGYQRSLIGSRNGGMEAIWERG
jgi:hypothetical protein